jgi:hypothetical protein
MSLSSLSESVLDLNVALTTVINLEKVLIDKEVIDEIIRVVVKKAKKGVVKATGCELHRLKHTKPSINAVKELVQGIPDALSFTNEQGQLPIQSAV